MRRSSTGYSRTSRGEKGMRPSFRRKRDLYLLVSSGLFLLFALIIELFSGPLSISRSTVYLSWAAILTAAAMIIALYFRGRFSRKSSDLTPTSRIMRSFTISFGLVLFFILIILPLTSIFKFAFQDGPGMFWEAVTSEEALNAFQNSLTIALICTAINLVVGTLMAFILVRYRFPGRSLLRALIDLPIAIPTAVVGLSLMMLYGPIGLLGPLLQERGIQVVLALPGVVLAHVFVTFPFMIRSVSVVLEKMDRNLEDSAMTLGAGRFRTFWNVVLPSIRTGMVAGSALTFTRSLGEFGATLFVAGGVFATGPLFIATLNEDIQFQEACSVSIVLMVFPFILLLGLNGLVDRMEGA
ncbi:MAG: ABC transporter permease [Thermoplasmatota archaeon]